MSLRIIERQIFAQRAREAEKAKANGMAEGLAVALQAEIDKTVKAAVETALAGQQKALLASRAMQPVHAPDLQRRLEALERRLQATATLPEIHRIQIERDGAGLARVITIGTGQRLLVQRGAGGAIVAMVPADSNAPVTYNGRPVKPAAINRRS